MRLSISAAVSRRYSTRQQIITANRNHRSLTLTKMMEDAIVIKP